LATRLAKPHAPNGNGPLPNTGPNFLDVSCKPDKSVNIWY
jgi:hypothetical protein